MCAGSFALHGTLFGLKRGRPRGREFVAVAFSPLGDPSWHNLSSGLGRAGLNRHRHLGYLAGSHPPRLPSHSTRTGAHKIHGQKFYAV